MGYRLVHDKKNYELVIQPIKNDSYLESYIKPGEVVYYNQNIYVSDERKLLKTLAQELKRTWILELQEQLQKLDEMVIKNKY